MLFKQTLQLLVDRQLDPLENPPVGLIGNPMDQGKVMSQVLGLVIRLLNLLQDRFAHDVYPPYTTDEDTIVALHHPLSRITSTVSWINLAL